uniref:Vacuolar protein sorting-associated protein 33B n=1 Tax=Panagrellus redivivus TaxID=6233 RepID=A0A7E4W9Z3_PANRE
MSTQLTRRELIHVLESIPGSKELVVEQPLMRPLDKFASMTLLQEHGCARVHQLSLDRAVMWDSDSAARVFLVRPKLAIIRKLCELIKAEPAATYAGIFVEKRLSVCDVELEKAGVFGLIEIFELSLGFIPLESDLFSLELPQIPAAGPSDYLTIAKSLWQLQSLYGSIPNQFTIGKAAVACGKIFGRISHESGEPPASANQPISHLFLFDRHVDLVSTLLTGLTYESMLNDAFQYSCGKIAFGEAVESRLKQKNAGRRVVALNNSDVIFSAVRNRHMTQVFPFLSAKAKDLQQSFDRASTMNKVEEVKDFVSNELRQLKQNHKLLELHICACEVLLESNRGAADRFSLEHAIVRRNADPTAVMEYLEICLCKQQNPWTVLQLACLWSICDDGLASKHFHAFRTKFLHACGYEYLPVLHYLQLNGLLTERSVPAASGVAKVTALKEAVNVASIRKGSFAAISKALTLCPESDKPFDAKSSTAPSYAFSETYTPLIVQMVAQTVSDGWSTTKFQKALGPDIPLSCHPAAPAKPDNRLRKAILVAFIGGVTFAEIAALRQFAQNTNFRIMIVTSHVIQREEFLKSQGEMTL